LCIVNESRANSLQGRTFQCVQHPTLAQRQISNPVMPPSVALHGLPLMYSESSTKIQCHNSLPLGGRLVSGNVARQSLRNSMCRVSDNKAAAARSPIVRLSTWWKSHRWGVALLAMVHRSIKRERIPAIQRSSNIGRAMMLRLAALLSILGGFAGAAWASIEPAVSNGPAPLAKAAIDLIMWTIEQLNRLNYLVASGAARDVLGLLIGTALIVPLMQKYQTSPIIGFLIMGMLLGPSGFGLIANHHAIHFVAEFGIIFFLFEMGLEVSLPKVIQMRLDVFGLGTLQYAGTACLIALIASWLSPAISGGGLVVLGGALALSSSAFVLQLIKDQGHLGTRYGKASLGILLFQDIAIVPLLVVVPLLAPSGGSSSLVTALCQAGLRALLSLGMIVFLGQTLLDKVFQYVTNNHSSEAFLSVTLGTVLLCSSITEGLGLSNTLGAFLGGVLLAETKYVHQVESDIAPFRGMLLGLFFVTVGFSIDLVLVCHQAHLIIPIVLGLLLLKGLVVAVACLGAGIAGTSTAQAAFLLAPGGEFAFVVFGMAERLGLLSGGMSKLLITCTALSMGLTPLLGKVGTTIAKELRVRRGSTSFKGEDDETKSMLESLRPNEFIIVCGYGRTGQVVCEFLDSKNIRYIVFDPNPMTSVKARASGLPVYMSDCSDYEVMQKFRVPEARLVVVTVPDQGVANNVVKNLKTNFSDLKVLVHAKNDDQAKYLKEELKAEGIVPSMPTDSDLLALPFAGQVLKQLGRNDEEVDSIVEEIRRKSMNVREAREVSMKLSSTELQEAFKIYDHEGTGTISRENVQNVMQAMGKPMTPEQIDSMLTQEGIEGERIEYDSFARIACAQDA